MTSWYWCICLCQHNVASWLSGTAAERNLFKINNNLRSKNVSSPSQGVSTWIFKLVTKMVMEEVTKTNKQKANLFDKCSAISVLYAMLYI